MNRVIKFRAKYPHFNHEWKYGLPCCLDRKHPLLYDSDNNDWDIDVDTLGEFTGVKDKNGVEIYEGDIVRFMYNAFKIVFGSISCRFDLININPNHFNDYLYGYNSDDYEVIGNIYDNPELLKCD